MTIVELTFRGDDYKETGSSILGVFLKGREGFESIYSCIVKEKTSPHYYIKKATLTFKFSKVQVLKFIVQLCTVRYGRADDKTPFGGASCSLTDIFNSPNQSLSIPLCKLDKDERENEDIHVGRLSIGCTVSGGGVVSSEIENTVDPHERLKELMRIDERQFYERHEYVHFSLFCKNVTSLVPSKQREMYYTKYIEYKIYFYKEVQDGKWRKIHETGELKQEQMKKGEAFPKEKILFRDLCDDTNKLVRLELHSKNRLQTGEDYFFAGSCQFKVQDVLDKYKNTILSLEVKKKKKNKKEKIKKTKGRIGFKIFQVQTEEVYNEDKLHELNQEKEKAVKEIERLRSVRKQEEYIPAFLRIVPRYNMRLIVAIDCSEESKELHDFGDDNNEFLKALKGVSEIIIGYGKDKSVSFYGFGGLPSIPGEVGLVNNKVNPDCFSMKGDLMNPEVDGVEGLLKTYKETITTMQFGNSVRDVLPLFEHLLKKIRMGCQIDSEIYYTVLVITSGRFKSMPTTPLTQMSFLPVSVVIVGVGEPDSSKFGQLIKLDEFAEENNNNNRDVVQFVPFRKYSKLEDLYKIVLHEIPQQLVLYERMKYGKMYTRQDISTFVREGTVELMEKNKHLEERVKKLEERLLKLEQSNLY